MGGMLRRENFRILLYSLVLTGTAHPSPDPRLTCLIPGEAQLVSGISASSSRGQPSNFVLMTGKNQIDLTDFYALTGGDDTRRIHQIALVALSDKAMLDEHSLLASGYFDKSRTFKAAISAGATIAMYRGIEVAEIQPFGRERKSFNEARWLAILDSGVLVFGSIDLIRLELDRYLSHGDSDESLLRRLGHLRSKNQEWCVLSGSIDRLALPVWREEIHSTLTAINPELANTALSADEFEFGLFFGRHVELEYFLSGVPDRNSSSSIDPLNKKVGEAALPTSLLASIDQSAEMNTTHRIITIPTSRFEDWLSEIANRR